MNFKEREPVKLNIGEKFPSEILDMIDRKPFFNLTIDSDFGQQWNLSNLTVADVYMFGNSYCKQTSDPKISKVIDQFYDTLIRLNPELANIVVENIDRKLDVIRGVGSGLHLNDIKYFVEDLKGTGANQNEQDFELNEQAYDIYQQKHGEDADHKIGYALCPETARRVIENIPYSKEVAPHFEIPNFEQGIQSLKNKITELEQELIHHFNGDKNARDEFFLNNYINGYNKTIALLESHKNVNRTNFLNTEKISDVNISDKSGVFVFKVGNNHVAKQNIPIEGTLKEIEATRFITSPRIHAISEIAFMDDHFYGGISLARGIHLNRADKLSLSEPEKKNLYSDLYELEKNNIGIDPSKHNNFYYEQGQGVHFIDLSPQKNNMENTKVFLGFFENAKWEGYESFKTGLKS